MANFISVTAKKYGFEDYTIEEADGYKKVGLSTEHIIYAKDIETLVGATAVQTASNNSITLAAHGLKVNDAVYFSDEIEGPNILADRIYFVKTVVDADKFSVSAALGGSEQGISSDGTVAANVTKIEAEIIYADNTMSGRPIEIILNTGLIKPGHGNNTVQDLSKQLLIIECNKKNGVDFTTAAKHNSNLIINTDRVMLSYNTTNGGDDWNILYDASKTNNAGFDSPFVDILESETSINSAGVLEKFVQHIGALGGPENFVSLTVNGNTVSFPDSSASGIVRLKNVVNAYEDDSKSYLKLKGMGKPGFDTLIINDGLSNVASSTDATNIVD